MSTPLYTTDIIPMTSRPTLTVMDDGDYFVILDTSTGKISKILKTLAMEALKISYDNTTSGLTADTVQAALDELVVNLGSTNTVIESLKGVGWTDENLVDHEDRLDTLEGTGEGSVYKAIDDALEPIEEDVAGLAGAGRTTETVKQNADDIATHTENIANPHEVTKAQVGLGNVDNTSDLAKPVSAAQQAALNLRVSKSDVVTGYVGGVGKVAGAEDVKSLKESVDVLTERGRHIYGIDMNESTGVVTLLYDRIGKTFAVNQGSYTHPANDFDNLYPWSAIRQVKMNDAGVVTSTRGDDTYAADTNDVMGALPKFWSRDEKVTIDGVVHHRMLITDQPGLYPAEGLFVDVDGTEHEYKYRARLHASVDGSGKIGSQPDRYPLVNTSMTSYRSKCASKGSRWHLYDKRWQHALWMLMVIEAGSMNLRSSYGEGVNATPFGTSSAYQITVAQTAQASVIMDTATANLFKAGMMVQVGTAYSNENVAANRKVISVEAYDETSSRVNLSGDAFDSAVGNFCVARCQPVTSEMLDIFEGGSGFYRPAGYANSQCNVCYRGFWDLWGNAWNWLDGVMKQDGRFYVCFDPAKYSNADDSAASRYPAVADGWVDIGYIRNIPNGYQKTRKIYSDGLHEITLPETTGGSSTAWICAYLYYFGDGYQEGSGIFAVHCGGNWNSGAYVSILFEYGNVRPSYTSYGIASSLILE